jgi:hypothetical protein
LVEVMDIGSLPRDPHIRRSIEPGLHLVEDVFMLPTLDPSQLVRRALRFERAGKASSQMSIMIDVVLAIRSRRTSR